MLLLSRASDRYVLLVVDDRSGSIATRLRCSLPAAEVVECGVPEGCSALASGRRYSAVVAHRIDAEVAGAAARVGTPVISVSRGLSSAALASAVAAVATSVPRADQPPPFGATAWSAWPTGPPGRRGHLVAVSGPGGTGASSVAAALAAALARNPPAETQASAFQTRRSDRMLGRSVPAGCPHPPVAGQPAVVVGRQGCLLADLALHADQAFLHGLGEPPSGLLQLVHAGRLRPITAVDVCRHTIAAPRFRLLPGLRRPEHWTAVSPVAFDEVLSGLVGLFDLVVADINGDFEGEDAAGSIDVEERNHMARTTAVTADLVVVVGGSGTNDSRRLALVVDDLLDLGVDPSRIQPVLNRCAEFSGRTPGKFSAPTSVCGLPATPVELPLLPDACGGLLPPAAVQPVATAVAGLLAGLLAGLPTPHRRRVPVLVTPGSLGCAAT